MNDQCKTCQKRGLCPGHTGSYCPGYQHYFRRQRRMGAALVLIGLLSMLPEGDLTAAVVLVPLGVWLITSKRSLINA